MGDDPRPREFIRSMRVVAFTAMIAGGVTTFFGAIPDGGPVWLAVVIGLTAIALGTVIVSLMVATLID